MLIGGLGTPEIIIIALVVLLLFGGKKIPELMKGVGKGINSFKKGMNEDDDKTEKISLEENDGKEVKYAFPFHHKRHMPHIQGGFLRSVLYFLTLFQGIVFQIFGKAKNTSHIF